MGFSNNKAGKCQVGGPVNCFQPGDLCNKYRRLMYKASKRIVERLDRSMGVVLKNLEDTRNALLS